MTRFGQGYLRTANEQVAVIPMIETAEAIGNVDEIARTPGVDALYVGPSDLSLTLGLPPAADSDDPVSTTRWPRSSRPVGTPV